MQKNIFLNTEEIFLFRYILYYVYFNLQLNIGREYLCLLFIDIINNYEVKPNVFLPLGIDTEIEINLNNHIIIELSKEDTEELKDIIVLFLNDISEISHLNNKDIILANKILSYL